MKERVYVCHTYYHVYVAMLKEFALPKEQQRKADILLSSLSTQFENLKSRLEKVAVFHDVIEFDEKRDTYFEELKPLREEQGNLFKNMMARIRFTKRYAQLEEPFIPVDFKEYKDIYVFCDSDPVGYYLNYKHIYYHAVEDGLNCLKALDAARYDNRGHFKLKVFFSSLNLIFIQNGYAKYCIDMEINDRECLRYDCPKYKVVPRKELEERLTRKEKDKIVCAFMENVDVLMDDITKQDSTKKNVIVLTEDLCTFDVRKQIFTDILEKYCQGYRVFFKPHPRDLFDYEKEFPNQIVLKGKYPLEVMKYIDGVHFHRAIAVFTQALYAMDFVDEKIFLGEDFMDQYESPEIHRYNDQI